MRTSAAILSIGGPTYESRVHLWWETDKHINPRNFKVYRGETTEDVTQLIGEVTGVVDQQIYTFDDYTANIRDRFRPWYYQIVEGNGDPFEEESRSEIFSWNTRYRIEEEAIMDAQELVFHYDMGNPVFIYSERTTSLKCPFCFNVTKGVATPRLDGCPTCMGTGRVAPYLTPYALWVDMGEDDRTALMREFGEHRPGQRFARVNGLPQVKPGDILLEPFTKIIWLINRVKPYGRQNAPVLQAAQMSILDKSDPINRYIDIDATLMTQLQEELDNIDLERRH